MTDSFCRKQKLADLFIPCGTGHYLMSVEGKLLQMKEWKSMQFTTPSTSLLFQINEVMGG